MNQYKLIQTSKTLVRKYFGLIFLFTFSGIGVLAFDDYGLAWDEEEQREIGKVSYDYVFNGDEALLSYKNKDHGVVFEMVLLVIEKKLGLKDSRDIYLMRHLTTHLMFLLCSYLFFLLIYYLYKSKLIASIGFLLIVLNPRIYAHSFFNTKDIPFLAVSMVFYLFSFLAFQKNKTFYFVLLGITCGVLISIRSMGLMFVAFIYGGFFIQLISQFKVKKELKKLAYMFVIFTLTFLISAYVLWPYLWINPINNFIEVFQSFSKFQFSIPILYFGEFINATELDWDYTIVWFLISNPIMYILLGVLGLIIFVNKVVKNPKIIFKDNREYYNLLYFFCFSTPFLAIIILKSTVYDDWRHLYFVYPSFVLFAVYGINYLLLSRIKKASILTIMVGFIFVSFFMIRNHPHQQVFFSEIMPKKRDYLRKNFEMDYWGVSYKQLLDNILKTDKSNFIKIKTSSNSGVSNALILEKKNRDRIFYVSTKESANYYITDYRWAPNQNVLEASFSNKVYNTAISSVFREDRENILFTANIKEKVLAHLLAKNNLYVCSEWDETVVASKTEASTWERFTLYLFEKDKCFILNHEGRFLSLKDENDLIFNKQKGKNAIFNIEFLNDNFIVIKAANGKYLSVDLNTLKINADAEKIGEKEKFKLIVIE